MDIITGAYLKELRESQGLSQTQLSKLTGISQAHIAKIENARVDPRISSVNKLLSVLTKKKAVRTCKEIMSRHIISVPPGEPLTHVVDLMNRHAISQVPIYQKGRPVGSISDTTVVRNSHRNFKTLKARDILDPSFPLVDISDPIDILGTLLEFHAAVLVQDHGKVIGIITKSNLLKIK